MSKAPLLLPLLLLPAMAAAEPPPAKRATVQTRAEQAFMKADVNHDGWLTKEEYRAAILAVARRYDPKVPTAGKGMDVADAKFDAIDTAHSGRISRATFIGEALAHFDGADLNHDGTVTPDEARKAQKIKQQAIRAQGPAPER